MLESVGESTFAIWLEPLELVAVDPDGVLVVSAPAATASWVRERFGRLITQSAGRLDRELRIADAAERAAAETLPAPALRPVDPADNGASAPSTNGGTGGVIARLSVPAARESADAAFAALSSADAPSRLQPDWRGDRSSCASAYGPSYPHAHNQ